MSRLAAARRRTASFDVTRNLPRLIFVCVCLLLSTDIFVKHTHTVCHLAYRAGGNEMSAGGVSLSTAAFANQPRPAPVRVWHAGSVLRSGAPLFQAIPAIDCHHQHGMAVSPDGCPNNNTITRDVVGALPPLRVKRSRASIHPTGRLGGREGEGGHRLPLLCRGLLSSDRRQFQP